MQFIYRDAKHLRRKALRRQSSGIPRVYAFGQLKANRTRRQVIVFGSLMLYLIYWQLTRLPSIKRSEGSVAGTAGQQLIKTTATISSPSITPLYTSREARKESTVPLRSLHENVVSKTGTPSASQTETTTVQNGQMNSNTSHSTSTDSNDRLKAEAYTERLRADDGHLGNLSDAFGDWTQAQLLDEKADTLPDLVHIPFEDAVAGDKLKGWEDEWIADGVYDPKIWGNLTEPKIDFIYLWVNGSERAFLDTIAPYEVNSSLNDAEGEWLQSHRTNRYRDWDELRYSVRSIEKYASNFRNEIQLIVNAVKNTSLGKQQPTWMNEQRHTKKVVKVLSQESFFDDEKRACLPTFNSLSIENQMFNTASDTDRFFALSDDMLLAKEHAASDLYSPLYGPTLGFKTNGYSTTSPPTEADAKRFGEKPFLIYTSWLLNRRFGERKRKGQAHFGHSMSRSVTKEAMSSFPGPELKSACRKFRGETGFQLYSWYATFHYTIERHREALLWSYIVIRSDPDRSENLSWEERQVIMDELAEGVEKESKTSFRARQFYHTSQILEKAGLEAPKVNTDVTWTSLDGPMAIQNTECFEFNVDECLAPGFSTNTSDLHTRNPVFSTATIFDRVSRQEPKCGDCLIKLLLNRKVTGLEPLLPYKDTQMKMREVVVKALMRYQYTVVNPDAMFVMVTDAEQVESVLMKRFFKASKQAGQLCLNDDVETDDEEDLDDLRVMMKDLYESMFPEKSPYEL